MTRSACAFLSTLEENVSGTTFWTLTALYERSVKACEELGLLECGIVKMGDCTASRRADVLSILT